DAGIAPAPAAPEAPAPAPAADESRQRARRTPAGEPAKRTEPPLAESLPGGGVAPSAGEDGTSADATEEEPVDEPSVDLGLLCGTVRDEEHHAIAGARVMMADVGVVVVTDRTGRFCLTAPRGARPLSVIALGFGTHRETVTVGRRTSELSVTLRATPAVSHAPSR
ncbi:MAG: carboxypeptidase-like regulatory domain-containing protein, partial [Candidatus Eiseniibacteriota bacterium]